MNEEEEKVNNELPTPSRCQLHPLKTPNKKIVEAKQEKDPSTISSLNQKNNKNLKQLCQLNTRFLSLLNLQSFLHSQSSNKTMSFSLFLLLIFLLSPPQSQAQTAPGPAPLGCNGVQLTYSITSRQKIRPFLPNPNAQPSSFKAIATVLNSGVTDLNAWALLIGFQHKELIVSATNAVLNNNSPFPFNTSDADGPASFSGFPSPDLKTPIETANDLSQIRAQIEIVGTFFGSPRAFPLPKSLSLDDPSFICAPPELNSTSSISTCCVPNPKSDLNETTTTADNTTSFLPRRSGDLSIFYDVIQAYGGSYLAQVTISNESPLGRLDNWQLSWEWMRGEFIYSIKGAYSNLIDISTCILGEQGQYYQDFQFENAVTCAKNPVILDLPLSRFNDSQVGKIPFCCRNGTILPAIMDPEQTKSRFQMQVFKMPPDLNRTKLFPPQNFKIKGGALNPSYQCGQPIRVAPTLTPDPSGLQSYTAAVATWQVICNITKSKTARPKCCVSFSSFYNDSVVPCNTCACGCPSAHRTCNASAPAVLLPPQALLVPFVNRTSMIREFAAMKHYHVPNPMPCGDFCGVSVNWHVNADYRNGWSARVTLFNWVEESFADWFFAVEMGKAYAGFEATYSFNGTAIGNNTIFMEGLPGLNYLVGEVDGASPGDPRVPGKQQTVISFTKKKTPGIDVVAGDGFPKRVFFNGEECSVPDVFPTSRGSTSVGSWVFSMVLVLVALLMFEL